MSLYGFGLGKMTIKSALDQPFLAEIELIDIPSVALSDVKVNLADPENFQQIGFERAPFLSVLNFSIGKNEQGKDVIKVHSVERMSEPYIELVVDLIWPKGQLYKAYTILLDPPGYQLVSSTIQGSPTHYKHSSNYNSNEPGVINKTVVSSDTHYNASPVGQLKDKSTYGPSAANESVWQIAQRYKTSDLILPQVVLCIVGANPEAFGEGNLNGLKVGKRLVIPSTKEMMQVPAQLATSEVMAHDNAWNSKAAIEHVLSPPYIGAQPVDKPDAPSSSSSVTPVSDASSIVQHIPENTQAPVIELGKQNTDNFKPHIKEQLTTSQAEISIAVAAIESIREANSSLVDQLHVVQKQNKNLEIQLKKSNSELSSLRAQMQLLINQRKGFFSDGAATESGDSSSSIWPYFLLLLAASAGGFAYWYFKGRDKAPLASDSALAISSSQLNLDRSKLATVTDETQIPSAIDSKENTSGTGELLNTVNQDIAAPSLPMPEAGSVLQPADKPQELEQQEGDKDLSQDTHILDSLAAMSINNQAQTESIVDLSKEVKGASKAKKKSKVKESFTKEQLVPEQPNQTSISIDELSKDNNPVPLNIVEGISPNIDYVSEDLLQKDVSIVEEPSATDAHPNEPDSGENHLLEFESGLHHLIPEQPEANSISSFIAESASEANAIDFPSKNTHSEVHASKEEHLPTQDLSFEADFFAQNEIKLNEPPIEKNIEVDDSISQFFIENGLDEPDKLESGVEPVALDIPVSSDIVSAVNDESLLKSKKALDTLLALAKTYLSMDDIESARHSLEEVLAHGSKEQQKEAQALLAEIKDK